MTARDACALGVAVPSDTGQVYANLEPEAMDVDLGARTGPAFGTVRVGDTFDVDVRVRAALFFSLKEAVYKAVAGDAAAGLALRHIRLGPFVDDACGVRVDNGVLPAGAAVDARWRVARIPAGDDRAYFLSTATYRRAPGA